jgi:hypothetical protein
MKKLLFILIILAGALMLTNPTEADYREYVRQKEGLAGSVGLVVADLITSGPQGGIRRENFMLASRFSMGGDGLLPRATLAWGIGKQFIETQD